MKYLKLAVIAVIMAFTFGSAKAQVVVRAHVNVGNPPPPPPPREVVVYRGGHRHWHRGHGPIYRRHHYYWRHGRRYVEYY